MFSIFRKRFPSKDRINDHVQIKMNDQLKKSLSTNDINMNSNENKKKKNKSKKVKDKQKCSSIFDGFALGSKSPSLNNRMNQSYSDVDYFPMMPQHLIQASNDQNKSNHRSSFSDCYLNPSELIQPTNIIRSTENSNNSKKESFRFQ